MVKEVLYEMDSNFREEYKIIGYRFGKKDVTKKAACIVGAMRGNEYQQLYICSQLIVALEKLEKIKAIKGENEILVIPSLSNTVMNIGRRFWGNDGSDLNREFPGNPKGETQSRIADALLREVTGYQYGIQIPSFYLEGEFIPHIRMMDTGKESTSLANLFGLPYVVTSGVRPYDKRTLNYNWQMRGTDAFSLYTNATDVINEKEAVQAVSAILRFLTRMGIIKYQCHNGYIATVLNENDLVNIKANTAGFLRKKVENNQEVKRGETLAEIIDPYEGSVLSKLKASTDGIIFYTRSKPVIFQNSIAFQIIKRLHS